MTRSRLVGFVSDPVNQIRWWASWTVIWVALDPISIVTGLQSRVWWISQMSDFANFASCGTALVAAWSYMRARRVDEANLHAKLDHVIEHHPDIPAYPGGTDGQ